MDVGPIYRKFAVLLLGGTLIFISGYMASETDGIQWWFVNLGGWFVLSRASRMAA